MRKWPLMIVGWSLARTLIIAAGAKLYAGYAECKSPTNRGIPCWLMLLVAVFELWLSSNIIRNRHVALTCYCILGIAVGGLALEPMARRGCGCMGALVLTRLQHVIRAGGTGLLCSIVLWAHSRKGHAGGLEGQDIIV